MKESKLIGTLLAMLAVASFLFLVGFSHVNQQYNLTHKITPVLKDIKEFIIQRNVYHTPTRETNLAHKAMIKPKYAPPLDVPLLNQLDGPALIHGCEVTSLAMLLHYQGIDVSKNKLANQIETVPVTYPNGLKGNPNEGFVGDMTGSGFSVWHKPIHDLAQKYVGEKAKNLTGSDVSTIYDYLDQKMPVWILIPTTYAPVNDFVTWNTPQGKVKISYKSHSAVVTGYTADHVYVNDPYGTKNKKVDRAKFEEAWVQMGSQAIVILD